MGYYERNLRWELDEDGGGTAWLFESEGATAGEVTQWVFDSLDKLPPDIAAAISKDGRQSGDIALP